ncbi:hypothetical protein [Streptomyces sp. NPDC048825]|uniref:hypothetical protein n=1 Tax=Streptomyces sp. NPDC048825 TaxID=3365592 RepID=UPI00371E82BD
MSETLQRVREALLRAGFDPHPAGDSGLQIRKQDEETVEVWWEAGDVLRPTAITHAAEPGLAGRMEIAGIHHAMDIALTEIFRKAGLHVTHRPDDTLLVQPPPKE